MRSEYKIYPQQQQNTNNDINIIIHQHLNRKTIHVTKETSLPHK